MVTSNKDAAKIWKEIEKARNSNPHYPDFPDPAEKGPNDLEKRIEDLLSINKKHQQQNGDLMKDNMFYKKKAEHYQIMSDQLKKELEELKRKTVGMLTEFRNKGDL
tara:strand:- start:265 stop:582 length:318 start_codon:yes stop_codon:yes gene_type:complete